MMFLLSQVFAAHRLILYDNCLTEVLTLASAVNAGLNSVMHRLVKSGGENIIYPGTWGCRCLELSWRRLEAASPCKLG